MSQGLRACAVALMSLVMSLSASLHANAQPRARHDNVAASQTARLSIAGAPEGAELFIDAESRGVVGGEPFVVSAGSHSVRVVKPGYTEFNTVVTTRAYGHQTVEVTMLAATTHVRLVTSPPASVVYVDNVFIGETPLDFELNEGARRVRIAHPGFAELVREYDAVAGNHETWTIELVPLPVGPEHTTLETGDTTAAAPARKGWYEEPVVWIVTAGAVLAVAAAITAAVLLSKPSTERPSCGGDPGCVTLDL